MSGSTGCNTFRFLETSGASANFGKDIIVDFQLGQDKIEIDHSLFANVAALQAAITDDCDGNAVITADACNTITVAGVSAATLSPIKPTSTSCNAVFALTRADDGPPVCRRAFRFGRGDGTTIRDNRSG